MGKLATGATPLATLEAIALDTETTGLDPVSARLVQIGLVPFSRGNIIEADGWEQIINPGVPIPPRSAEIHRITDTNVRDAPGLSDIWPEFTRQIEGQIVIGHAIGFDLAVLEAEARRSHLPWKRPRALCVRMLARLVSPSLANHSLDALASWLGAEMGRRHQALGDAVSAARVFSALVPKLAQSGIETLAQAERASRLLTPEVEQHQSAGWQLPVEPGEAARQKRLIGGSQSFAYRVSVGEVMSSPPLVIGEGATLKQAMDTMTSKAVSSVFVSASGKPGGPVSGYGILTERDVMRRISANGASALDLKAGELANSPVNTIRESAFIYRAMGRMTRLKHRHLGVRNDEGVLTGVISARDLLKIRAGPAIVLDDTIEAATNPQELAAAWASLPAVTQSLLEDDTDARIVCRIISEEIRSMTRRAAILAEQAMQAEGKGPPPCRYAVMVLGSGGRGESMLVPDQDNAIVFEAGVSGSATDQWFAELSDRFAASLDEAGIPLCKGGVMAKNPQWRGSLGLWKDRIDDWVRRSRGEDLLNVDIFFDQMPVHGEIGLGMELFRHAYERGHSSTAFAKLLGETLTSIPDPFGMFGALRAQNNKLDLKSHILFPVSALARALAIRHNIARHSTLDRIQGLIEQDLGGQGDLAGLLHAHGFALSLVLDNQGRDIENGLKPANFIDLAGLSRDQTGKLKDALRRMRIIPDLARQLMFA